jgi:hypothetical protein
MTGKHSWETLYRGGGKGADSLMQGIRGGELLLKEIISSLRTKMSSNKIFETQHFNSPGAGKILQ